MPAALVAAAACGATQQGRLSDEFRERIAALNAELANGDTGTVRPQLAGDLEWVTSAGDWIGKRQLLAAIATPQDPRTSLHVDSVVVHPIGDIVLAEYRRTDHRRVGRYEFPASYRVSEIYVADGTQWQLTRHFMTMLPEPPERPQPLDSTLLAEFVGFYEIHPDYVDNVHFEGRSLVATVHGQTVGARLVPISTDAFLPDGSGHLIVFERDRTGRVTGYVQGYPNGVVIRARRLAALTASE
jgi:hypothetical protein